ncbi:lipocalin-like [Astyanax mexicanus]|uniref:Lipocalin-like n=1 Tax=Astyanax mexicanus TaxID=7994 RepID=A0A8T2MEC1_ASTMX|nr:lipocalin-like [Astyanax mexicanus]KAG9281534.1 lipocalin-like [Astyanax mexicanus]
MATTTLGMLGVLLIAVASSGATSDRFNVQQLAGKWYSIRSSSNAPWFVRLKDRLSMEEIIVTPQPSGDILLETTFLSEDGSCRKLSDMASKTSIPGRFTFYVEKYGTTNVFQVLDMKADEYVIAYFIVSDEEDRNYTISRLMTRKKEAKAEVIEKFKTITEEQGIKSENTAILSKFEGCN